MRSTSQRDNETQQAENGIIHWVVCGCEEGNVSLRCDFIMQAMSETKDIFQLDSQSQDSAVHTNTQRNLS